MDVFYYLFIFGATGAFLVGVAVAGFVGVTGTAGVDSGCVTV